MSVWILFILIHGPVYVERFEFKSYSSETQCQTMAAGIQDAAKGLSGLRAVCFKY